MKTEMYAMKTPYGQIVCVGNTTEQCTTTAKFWHVDVKVCKIVKVTIEETH